MQFLLYLVLVPVGLALLVVALTVAVAVPVSVALVGVLLLQLAGVLKRVPFSYNLRNLIGRWKTTALTAVAFTLVVVVLTVMLAFVNGMYKLTEKSGIPSNVIVLADGATDELFSNLGYGDVKEIELREEVARDDDGKPLASWEVYVVVNQPILTRRCPHCGGMVPVDRFGQKLTEHGDPACPGSGVAVTGSRGRRFVSVRGVEDPVKTGKVHGMSLHEGGSWFGTAGVEALPGSASAEQAIQAVIGEGLARELGPDQGKRSLEVGDLFELGPRKWVVVGILQSAGSTFDSEVWAKFSLISQLFGKSTYTTCVLRTADPATAADFAKDLSANYKKPAVSAQTEPEYYSKLNATNQQFLFAIAVVVLIMAVGSVFGVMNTMFAAIAQRTKDIGVLRILGYARWQVLASFFMESLALALIGGLIGCALGSLANGISATSIISSGQGGGKSVVLKLVVDFQILAAAVGFSLFMGCLGGLIPALSAMRLKPLEAVR
jgi:ABC-type lipoprotein release transport system permease subunit